MAREWRRLKKVEEDIFVGECDSDSPEGRIYGGQVLAQSMSAAYFTAPHGFYVHALHCYFVRAGEEGAPIIYNVKRIRDGRNFALRCVDAVQHGKVIHIAEFSLQKLNSVTENFSLTPAFPDVPAPETLQNKLEARKSRLAEGHDEKKLRGLDTERMAPSIEVRPCDIDMYFDGTGGVNKKQYFWMKYKPPVESEDYMMRHASLVYLSDLELVTTGVLCFDEPKFKLTTSLDHSVWIHQFDFDINEWILYEQECVANSKHRCLINGRMWTRDGRLIMSTSQEALIYKLPSSHL
ncbi:unnamed protein product [Caenorhabditis auriculariae]|uniref:Uncharacterized protein n=1 Tax=Caenorhabditis auriculariae TaxID=2777116 RepID=A0A8S1GTP6_9PELO|nr:unnamed protein product [Caenorhabditis auriculariae]